MPRVKLDRMFGVKGLRIAITGGGGVLCGEWAKGLAALGARVAVLDLIKDAADKVAADIRKTVGEAVAVQANVLDRKSLDAARDAVVKAFGGLDVLINGAGGNKKEATVSPTMSFFDIPPEAVRFVFDLNLIGTVLPSQVLGKVLADAKRGVILNTSSMNAYRPLTNVVAYSAAKAAVSNFTQWLAVHMSQNYSKDIRVNAIAPGFFLTQQNRFLLTDEKTGELTPRGKTIIAHTPMGRFGEPQDLFSTVVWLISDGAKFVHGQVIPVDGGFSAFSGV
jgi:NAD(P)-dependent dehydrogenase (short-subunit alcohol dehydrogenase family)